MDAINLTSSTRERFGERHTIRVCAPSAHSGIGDALRRAFVPPKANGIDREFNKMLEQV